MSYKKLVERDINQLRFPFETVRLHIAPEDIGILTLEYIMRESS